MHGQTFGGGDQGGLYLGEGIKGGYIWGRGSRGVIFIPIKNEAKDECACDILIYGLPKILGGEGGFGGGGERERRGT